MLIVMKMGGGLYCVKWPAWAETSGNIIRNASFTFGKGLMIIRLEMNYNDDDDDDDEKEDFLMRIREAIP